MRSSMPGMRNHPNGTPTPESATCLRPRITVWEVATALAVIALVAAPLLGVNGEILDQQVAGGEGYTVLRVWGSHYDMGYAHAHLMHGEIALAVEEARSEDLYLIGRAAIILHSTWAPAGIEDEFDGMVDALAVLEPNTAIDDVDLKVVNLASDLLYMDYACRSHSCWGHFVAPPIKTISTRRLDFNLSASSANHHVLCVWLPTDGSPAWANLGWPGYVCCVTGVNEFGTIASLHDYDSNSDLPLVPWLGRSAAARFALTMVTDPDPSTHADDAYAALQTYNAGTGSFINYYVPDGHGGVITCRRTPAPTFYKLRKPHPAYFGGDCLVTTNSETDGSYTPADGGFMEDYYQDLEDANETATLLSHWDLMNNTGLHKMTIGYRDRGDLAVWFDGDLKHGRTPRLELEWTDLDTRRSLTLNVVNGSWGTVDVNPNQPIFEPNQPVTLTATPIDGKGFKQWEIYDPNHPGDANYAAIDANSSIAIVMNVDREVTAVFKCGGAGHALPLLMIGVALCGFAAWRASRRRAVRLA